MTVCLVLPGDSAFPGARERMCSGFPYWKRPMLSMHDTEVMRSSRLGGFSTKLSPEAQLTSPGPQSPMYSSGSVSPDMDTGFRTMVCPPCPLFPFPYFPALHRKVPSFLSPSQICPHVCFQTFSTSSLLPCCRGARSLVWKSTCLFQPCSLSTPSTWGVHLAQETGSLLGRCLSRGTQKASRMSSLGLWGLNLGWSLFAPLPCASLPMLEEGRV